MVIIGRLIVHAPVRLRARIRNDLPLRVLGIASANAVGVKGKFAFVRLRQCTPVRASAPVGVEFCRPVVPWGDEMIANRLTLAAFEGDGW